MMSDLQMVQEKIKEIIVSLINRNENYSLTVEDIDADVELSGNTKFYLNSISAMRLLVEIEKEYNIEVPDDSLTIENFLNVNAISKFVLSLFEER